MNNNNENKQHNAILILYIEFVLSINNQFLINIISARYVTSSVCRYQRRFHQNGLISPRSDASDDKNSVV